MTDRKIEQQVSVSPPQNAGLKKATRGNRGRNVTGLLRGRSPMTAGPARGGRCDGTLRKKRPQLDSLCLFSTVLWEQASVAFRSLSDPFVDRCFINSEGNLMFTKKQVGVLAAAVGPIRSVARPWPASPASSTMTVDTTLTTGRAKSPHFRPFGFVASSHWQAPGTGRDSGSTFRVACSNSATPTIYATGTRSDDERTFALPFNLSLTFGVLPAMTCRRPRVRAQRLRCAGLDLHDVVVYAKTYAADFKALPSAHYTADVTVWSRTKRAMRLHANSRRQSPRIVRWVCWRCSSWFGAAVHCVDGSRRCWWTCHRPGGSPRSPSPIR